MNRSTQATLLLTVVCVAVYVSAYILFMRPLVFEGYHGFLQGLSLILYFFGVIPCMLIFRAPGWAWATTGALAISTALVLGWITVNWFVSWAKHADTAAIIGLPVLRLSLSSLQFVMLDAALATVVLAYMAFGLRIFINPAKR